MKTKNELKLGYAVKNSKTSAYLYGNKNIVRMSDNDEQHITVFVFRHVPRHDNGPDHIYYTDPRQGGYDVPSELLRMVENSAAAATLGSIKSPRKAASSRENGKWGGRKSLLRRACENNYGFLDVTPGTDIAGRLGHVSESSITKYIKNGWVKKIGSGLVLTHDGYNVL